MNDQLQEHHDRYYMKKGPCCAGCDHWRSFNSTIGECSRTVPVSGKDKIGMLGMVSVSMDVPPGHIWTPIDHVCGEFKDTFDWSTLGKGYLVRIGAINNVHDIKVTSK